MNAARAEEILRSKEVIDVAYRNQRVWIEKINKQCGTAMITYLNGNDTIEASIEQLAELH